VKRDCNLVFGVGQQLVASVRMAATAHPEVKFALVDAGLSSGNGNQLDLPNVKNIEFDATQAAFMAGYLAASQTGSSTIGLIAGARSHANLNQVFAFRQGVPYFDSKHSKSTVLIGAIGDAPETWSFLGSNPTRQAIHYKISGMTNAGADVIYGVGLPGLYVTKLVSVHPDVLVIGTDSDWWTQPGFADFKKVVLASTTKKIADAVVRTVGDAVSGIFVGGTGGSWLGTLGTGDVMLTEQHDVPYSIGIQSELDSIKSDLISGRLSIDALSDL
jgi:basic membrane protein A